MAINPGRKDIQIAIKNDKLNKYIRKVVVKLHYWNNLDFVSIQDTTNQRTLLRIEVKISTFTSENAMQHLCVNKQIIIVIAKSCY